MKLIIDVGNTNIKIGVFKDSDLLKKNRFNIENKIDLTSIFLDFPNINQILFCGKKRKLKEHINNIINNKNVNFIEWGDVQKDMIDINYNEIEELGFDRLGSSVGAIHLYPEFNNHLIIDIGSCITYDLILDKKYKGGQISPGINIRLKSLSSFTTSLPNLQFVKPEKILGDSTKNSIQSGVFFGVNDEIKARIELYKKEITSLNVILTGGDAYHFKNRIKNVVFDDDLLMKGLNLLLNYNVEK